MEQHHKLLGELHKRARRNCPRSYARENKGIKYLLTISDVLSKFAWAVPVKRKKAPDVTAAMDSVLQRGRVLSNV